MSYMWEWHLLAACCSDKINGQECKLDRFSSNNFHSDPFQTFSCEIFLVNLLWLLSTTVISYQLFCLIENVRSNKMFGSVDGWNTRKLSWRDLFKSSWRPCEVSRPKQMLKGVGIPQFWTDLSASAGTFEAQRSAWGLLLLLLREGGGPDIRHCLRTHNPQMKHMQCSAICHFLRTIRMECDSYYNAILCNTLKCLYCSAL